jgi:hypothetical protein
MAVALSIEPGLMTNGFIARRFKEVALLAALIGLAIGTYYVVQYAEMPVLFSSVVGSHDVVEDSVANERADKVTASTETSGDQQAPARTVLRLMRAHHWFSTTLLETESYCFQWDAEWRDDDIVDLYIGFGSVERLGRPVTMVGQIRVFYHFTYDNQDLDLDLARSGRSDSGTCLAVHHSGGSPG